MAKKYFSSLHTFTSVVDDHRTHRPVIAESGTNLDEDSKEAKKNKKPKKKVYKPADSVKFANIDAFAYAALC